MFVVVDFCLFVLFVCLFVLFCFGVFLGGFNSQKKIINICISLNYSWSKTCEKKLVRAYPRVSVRKVKTQFTNHQ